jgi:hypothetical protein
MRRKGALVDSGGPISVVDLGYAVDWGSWDALNQPHNPYQPRSFKCANEFWLSAGRV